jgi:signal transduction histidine kinase
MVDRRHPPQESALARAKNTSRSEARRRTREQTRAEIAAEQEPEDGAEVVAAPKRRPMLFQWPDIRADLRALPDMFRTRRLLWLPFILLLVGFVLALAFNVVPAEYQQWALLYFQYFFAPQALFTYFIGGFVATRASYLVGFILGLLTGVMWSIVLAANTVSTPATPDTAGLPSGTDLLSTIGTVLVASMVLGTFAAGFAGWYRDFLRGMQNRSKDRQAQREQEQKAKRAAERQEARRAAKQKPAS